MTSLSRVLLAFASAGVIAALVIAAQRAAPNTDAGAEAAGIGAPPHAGTAGGSDHGASERAEGAATTSPAGAAAAARSQVAAPAGAPRPDGHGAPPANAHGRAPDELGRIAILEYHLVGEEDGRWQRDWRRLRRDLELLYARGYRPVSVAELVDGRIDLPAGLSPVVFTFDDASPGQFRYLERDGELVIDSTSAVGVWLDFARERPDWRDRAVFCVLADAEEGRSLFGKKGIEGQKTEWRHRKVAFLAERGFELCNHTLWHANLGKYGAAMVQEQIARGAMAIDSAVPGYRVRTFALPLGVFPKDRDLARRGSWTEPRTGRTVEYRHDAILLVAGEPVRSPHDPAFDPLRLERVQVYGDELERVLDRLEPRRYVSDGDPSRVTAPPRKAVAPEP